MLDLSSSIGTLLAAVLVVGYLAVCVRVVKEYERGVMFLLGRYVGVKEPGLRFVFVPVYRMRVVDLRIIAEDVPPQDIVSRDNVSATVNAVIYYRVLHPDKAVLEVEDYKYATSQLAQTSLRSIVGANDLDDLLAERDKLNQKLQTIIDEQSDAWGIKITSVEIKHVDLPQEMRRAIARQAVAERERRAKVIAAEGEFQAARKLTDAAEVLKAQPNTLQLRYLQTLVEIGGDNNTFTILPLPLDFLRAFDQKRPAELASENGSSR